MARRDNIFCNGKESEATRFFMGKYGVNVQNFYASMHDDNALLEPEAYQGLLEIAEHTLLLLAEFEASEDFISNDRDACLPEELGKHLAVFLDPFKLFKAGSATPTFHCLNIESIEEEMEEHKAYLEQKVENNYLHRSSL